MFDDLFDKHISSMNLDGISPICENVHPLIKNLFAELYSSDDIEGAWRERLTDLEKQMRVCLTNEMREIVLASMPPAIRKHFEPYWDRISFYILTIAWLSKRAIGPEFGE